MAYPVDPTDPRLQPFLGHMTAVNPVADIDYVYLSAEGPAYRHYKDRTGAEFSDELLAAGGNGFQSIDTDFVDPTAPLGGTGAQYPIYSAPFTIDKNIGVPSVTGSNTIALGSTEAYSVAYTGDATSPEYTWSASSLKGVTIDTPKASSTNVTVAADGPQGDVTLFCEIRDGLSVDYSRTASFSVEFQ